MEFIKKYFNPLHGALTFYYKIVTNLILGSFNKKAINLSQSFGVDKNIS